MTHGALFVKIAGEYVPVADCEYDPTDGGIFTTRELDTRKRPAHVRIATMPERYQQRLRERTTAQDRDED